MIDTSQKILNGWKLTRLGDVLSGIDAGVSPKALDRPARAHELGVLKVSAVTWNEFRPYENKALPNDFDATDCPRVRQGDLLLSRANTAELLAAPVIARDDYPNLLLSDKTLRLVPKREVGHASYLLHVLRTRAARRYFESHATGTSGSMRNVSQATICACPIPLPPLVEQWRIAAILDQAEALRAKRRHALAQLDTLTQSLFFNLFGDPDENPNGWPIQPVSAYVAEFQGGRSLEAEGSENAVTRNRVLKVSAVTGMVYRPEESKPVPDSYEPPAEHFVKAGDLLFSRANTTELVGAVAYVQTTPPNALLPDKLWRFVWRKPELADPLFVWVLFQTPAVRREIGRRATGTSGSMKNISQEKVYGIQTILPPIPLQREFAAQVSAVERLKASQWASLAKLDALFASLQHRTFRGEL